MAAVLSVDQNNGACTDSGSGTQAQPFCTIGAAAAQAVAGDTVQVNGGSYAEEVNVTVSGTQAAPVLFQAANGVTVTGQISGFDVAGANWVTIDGFTITGTSSHSIRVTASSNVTISNNQVSNAGDRGMYLLNSSELTIADNSVVDSASYGIYANSCDNAAITGNTVSGSGQPISGGTRSGHLRSRIQRFGRGGQSRGSEFGPRDLSDQRFDRDDRQG